MSVPPDDGTAPGVEPVGAPPTDAVVRRSRRPRSAHPGRRWFWFAAVLALAAGALAAVALVGAPVPEVAGTPEASARARAVGTPALSARRVPVWTARPVAARNVAAAAAPALGAFPPDACVVVRDGGVVLVDLNGATPLVPASNMKVVTAAAALALLGPDTRLSTTFRAGAPPVDGTLTGDLWMVGGGDPLLATGTYAPTQSSPTTPVTSMEAAADALVAGGLRRVTGSVVGDESRYDTERARPSWPARFVEERQVANLSALTVNDAWSVGALQAGPDPAPVAEPALYAAAIMTELLRARGVVVDGPPGIGAAPPTSVVVGAMPSATVAEIVGEMLAFSDNTTAELLVKEIGRVAGGAGSSDAGLAAVRRWLDEQGLPTAGVVLADGSGLSGDDRLTCGLLAALLVRSGPDGTLANGLARPGRPGTLSRRLREDDVRERVRAKTGSLNAVRSLSGWLTTVPGRPVAFAMLSNTGTRLADEADEAVEESFLRTLLAYPQTPSPADLGPSPARG